MDLGALIIITIFFGGYLVFFFKVIYPQTEQSRSQKYLPFGLIVGCTGCFYGLIIYLEVVLQITLNIDVYLYISYVFIIVLAINFHLQPIPFTGRLLLYGLSLGMGAITYLILLVYIKSVLEGVGSQYLWALIVGGFSIPLSVIGIWGLGHEVEDIASEDASAVKWAATCFAIMSDSLFSLAFGIAMYSESPWVGTSFIIICIAGSIITGILIALYHIRRRRLSYEI